MRLDAERFPFACFVRSIPFLSTFGGLSRLLSPYCVFSNVRNFFLTLHRQNNSPGQFKHVIASALGHWADRQVWGRAVAEAAMEYREQVVMDFECFREYVDANYPPLS